MRKLILAIFLIFSTPTAFADRIAVIGGGASGLMSAWLLEAKHNITLYEASDRLGGHANTIEVRTDENSPLVIIEAGAEFFNKPFYPSFFNLLNHFKIPVRPFTLVMTAYRTDNTDAIILPTYHDHQIEWVSTSAANIKRSIEFKIVVDNGLEFLKKNDRLTTLQTFIDSLSFVSNDFKNSFFYPLTGASWGIDPQDTKELSAYNALNYISNNYLIPGYTWYEVKNGLTSYIDAVAKSLENTEVKLNAKVLGIHKNDNNTYTVIAADGSKATYDQLVFATDAEIASKILSTDESTQHLSEILNRISYYDTKIAIHGDERFMPKDKSLWRIVNVRNDGKHGAITFYKKWKSSKPIFKSWLTYDVRSPDDKGPALPSPLYALVDYRHLTMNATYHEVQRAIEAKQGQRKLWFAGMWMDGVDTHESAIRSAMYVAKRLAPNTERLAILEKQ